MEHDPDQDKLINRKPSTGKGVGGSVNKTPELEGDDNPMPPVQNFFPKGNKPDVVVIKIQECSQEGLDRLVWLLNCGLIGRHSVVVDNGCEFDLEFFSGRYSGEI